MEVTNPEQLRKRIVVEINKYITSDKKSRNLEKI